MTSKLLNWRQARWAVFLSRFNFKITYRSGKQGGKPDALTRRSGDLPVEGDETFRNQTTVLKSDNLDPDVAPAEPQKSQLESHELCLLADIQPRNRRDPLRTLFERAYQTDKTPTSILQALEQGDKRHAEITQANCENREGILFYRNCFFVPRHEDLQLHLMQSHHDAPAFGHPGCAKTHELLQRNYYWNTMHRDIGQFVRNCDTCQRSRTSRHAPYGHLQSLPILQAPWQDISIDFMAGLPWSNGYDAIWVVVDRLAKQRHLVPCTSTVDAKDLADLIIQWVFRLHGLPETITSDRGPQFASHFWVRLCERLQIGRHMSTAFHPQTDGQTERFNLVIEQYLRSYVNYQQDDWSAWLPLAEFAANNHLSEATKQSPFFALHGYHPRATTSLLPATEPTPGDPDAHAAATAIQEIHDYLQAEMGRAQAIQAEGGNCRRTPVPVFRPGNQVWLDARNIKSRRPSVKLYHRWLGPYEVIESVGANAV